jgi:hypothetical protein
MIPFFPVYKAGSDCWLDCMNDEQLLPILCSKV